MKRQFMHIKPSSGQHPPASPPQAPSPQNPGVSPGSGEFTQNINQNSDFATMPVSEHNSGISKMPMSGHGLLSSPFVSPNESNGPTPSPFNKPSASNGPAPSQFSKPGFGRGPASLPAVKPRGSKAPSSSPLGNPSASKGPVLSPFGKSNQTASPVAEPVSRFPGNTPSQAAPFANVSTPVAPKPSRPQTGNLNPGPMSAPGIPGSMPRPQTGNLNPGPMSVSSVPGSMPSMSGIQAPPLIPQGMASRAPGQAFQTPPPTPLRGKIGRKKRRFPIWARVLVAVLTFFVVVGGAGFWYYQVNFASSVGQITGRQVTKFDKNGNKTTEESSQNTGNNGGMLSGGRVNILLLGSDNDGKGNDGKSGSPLAQTDIVVTIDPSTNYVGMLSIPRDMRVYIPGNSAGKMDFAFSYGYQSGASKDPYADAAGLAEATVKANFNIDINYYAWVGLDGFIKVINTAGGVDVDALHPMVDDVYPNDVKTKDIYGFKRLYVAPGPQHMSGIEALEYVRTRHSDLGGDFGRSVRQQQILTALKGKLQSSDTVNKLPEYAKDLTGYLRTDMQIPDVIKMANFARTIDASKINKLVLSPPYSTSISGSSDYAPLCGTILPDLQKMFGSGASCMSVLGNTTQPLSKQDQELARNNPSHVSANTPNEALASAQQMTSMSTMSVPQTLGDPFGVRSLLDLMCMVTFENIKV